MERTSGQQPGAGGVEAVAERLRVAVQQHPRKMTLQLAREYGVPEVEVIRVFPGDRAAELDIARWEDLFRSFEALGPVRVIVSNAAATVEVAGHFGGFSITGSSSTCRPTRSTCTFGGES